MAAVAAFGPFMVFGLSNLWSMIEGMQLILHFPMMLIAAPANLATLQKAIILIATFEIDKLVNEEGLFHQFFWGKLPKETVDPYLEKCGYESRLFILTFGFPIYLFALTTALTPFGLLLNIFKPCRT
jgi:hypothetical protein